MILIIDCDGKRLCHDDCFRDFANFGDFGSCVKVYKSLAWAKRKANHIQAHFDYQKKNRKISVVQLPNNSEINASGDCWLNEVRHSIFNWIIR